MRKRECEQKLIEEIREKNFLEKQIQHNSKIDNFENASINMLILEILTKLTGKNSNNEKYTENMITEHIHQYIQDLGVLFNIRKNL